MRKPNLFIVGAPKCGTTSMHTYLGAHPEIFMSQVKEPCYFGDYKDKFDKFDVTLDQYLALFSDWEDEKYGGEATPNYLYTAVHDIKDFNPAAKIIIMLRNPIDFMYSLHSGGVMEGHENLENFEAALAAEEFRKQGMMLPTTTFDVRHSFYSELAKFTPYVKQYCDNFGRENVFVCIFDDLQTDTAKVYRDLLEFLEVDPDYQPNFEIKGSNAGAQSMILHKMLKYCRHWGRTRPWYYNNRNKLLILRKLGLNLEYLNRSYKPRPRMAPELRRRLQGEFAPEVEQLSELIGRDLTHWSRQ